MKKLILIAFVMLAGCAQSLAPTSYVRAEQLCSNNSGVEALIVKTFSVEIYCNNKAIFEIDKEK